MASALLLILFLLYADPGVCQDNETSPSVEGLAWAPIPFEPQTDVNITINGSNYEQVEHEIAVEIRREGKNWVADINPDFANLTDFSGLLGGVIEPIAVFAPPPAGTPYSEVPRTVDGHKLKRRKLPPKRVRSAGGTEYDLEDEDKRFRNLPTRYDLRWDYPECTSITGSVRDQLRCNGCWAFAAASVMSDRHCIYNYPRKGQVYLSTMELLSCVPSFSGGCSGGHEFDAFKYWAKKGVVSGGTAYREAYQPDGCLPVPSDVASRKLTCPTSCSQSYYQSFQQDKTYGGEYYHWFYPSVEIIQREIYKYGPVTALFTVYQDFITYKGGVYEPVTTNKAGVHVVKLIGWGTEGGVDYWLAVNSWGVNWGDRGVFKVRRGVNTCLVETRIGAGLPKEGAEP